MGSSWSLPLWNHSGIHIKIHADHLIFIETLLTFPGIPQRFHKGSDQELLIPISINFNRSSYMGLHLESDQELPIPISDEFEHAFLKDSIWKVTRSYP